MRLRAEYSVGAELKFLANLDMMHLMERTLRRANIPYHLSEGFNPHIRMSMGTILPVGVWGMKEYFDLELSNMPVLEFQSIMNTTLPPGMHISACKEIPLTAPSVMKVVNAADYVFMMEANCPEIESFPQKILSQEKIVVQSRGKNKAAQKDLRRGIYGVEIEQQGSFDIIILRVAVNEPINVRFDELLDVINSLGINNKYMVDFWRRGNYIKQGENYYSPLEKVQ